jgi:hypothetical protein
VEVASNFDLPSTHSDQVANVVDNSSHLSINFLKSVVFPIYNIFQVNEVPKSFKWSSLNVFLIEKNGIKIFANEVSKTYILPTL